MTRKASVFSGAIFRPLLSNRRVSHHRLLLVLSLRILTSSAGHTTSASSAKPMMLVTAGSSKQLALPVTPEEHHMLRPFIALIYHSPVVYIVIYHPQQVFWNLLLHHRLDADLPSRGIECIAHVNADHRPESLTLTSSSSCICGNVYYSLDGVHSGPVFPEPELVLRKTALSDKETLKSLSNRLLQKLPQ